MSYVAVTVLGHDRPGIIAEAADALSRCGMNLEDSSMTLLRGHFAMTLICAGPASSSEIEAALAPLTESLTVDVRDVPVENAPPPLGEPYLITVHGADRLGLVARVARVVAESGGNITDLTTRLTADLYVLVAEVDLDPTTEISELSTRISAVAAELGVRVDLRPLERDEL